MSLTVAALSSGTNVGTQIERPLGSTSVFEKIMKGIAQSTASPQGNDASHLQHLLTADSTFDGRELLLMQLRVNQTHLKVEMTAKVADAVQATFKRLQQS